METERHIVISSDQFTRFAAEKIATIIGQVLTTQDRFGIMLTGGRTAAGVYRCMAKSELRDRIPWEKLDIFFGDERCVAPTHPESNFRMASTTLLEKVSIQPDHIHRMQGENRDIPQAALSYEQILPSSLDLVLLSIGEDGHIASLFPNSAALLEKKRRVVPVVGPKPPPERLTITPQVIANARHVLVLAAGSDKKRAVAMVIREKSDYHTIPAQLVQNGSWVIDQAAGALLA